MALSANNRNLSKISYTGESDEGKLLHIGLSDNNVSLGVDAGKKNIGKSNVFIGTNSGFNTKE